MNPARRGFNSRLDPEQRRSRRVWFRVNAIEFRAIKAAAGGGKETDWARAVVLSAAGIPGNRLTAPSR